MPRLKYSMECRRKVGREDQRIASEEGLISFIVHF